MKKKILLTFLIVSIVALCFAITVSAATADNTKGTAKYDTTKALYDVNGEALTWYINSNGETVYELTKNVISLNDSGTMSYITDYVPSAQNVIIANFKNANGTDVKVDNNDIVYFTHEMFYKSQNITHVYIPSSLESLSPNINDPRNSFRECSNIAVCSFPTDSKVTALGKFTFSKSGLKEFYIPASIKTLAEGEGNGWWGVFSSCKSLQTVTFDKNSQITFIPGHCFHDCLALKEIVLPNSVEYVSSRAFQAYNGQGSLEKIVFGASFKGFKNTMGGDTWFIYQQKQLKEIYFPASFVAENCTADWKQLINESGSPTIYYAGTEKAWDELVAAISSTANNNNSYIINAKANGKVKFFNTCEFYYAGNHLSIETTYDFDGEKYTSDFCSYTGCTRCNDTIKSKICGPLFVDRGYSKAADGTSFTYGITINDANIQIYKETTGNDFSYGFIVGAVPQNADGKIVDSQGNALIEKSVAVDFANVNYKSFAVYNLKMVGIETDAQKSQAIYCCAYIIDAGAVSYMAEGVAETAVSISSNAISKIEQSEK